MKINRTATTRRLGRTATAVLVGLSLTATACGGSNESADNPEAELAELIDLVVESASERLAESQTISDIDTVAAAAAPNTAVTPTSSASPSSSDTSRTDDDTRVAPAATPDTSTSDTPASPSSDSDDPADTPMDDTTGDATESAPIEPAGDADEPMADEPMDDGYDDGYEADEPMDDAMDDGYDDGYEADEPMDDAMDDEPMDEGYDDGNTIVSELVVDIDYSAAFGKINVDAELTGILTDNYKGIASVCLVQYNEYGNPVYTGNARAYTTNASYVDIDGVRYPDLIVNGCRPDNDNFGEYTTHWSVESARGTNGSRKDYYDIAVRGVDGQVSVFCMNAENWRNGFVKRDMSDYAGSTKLGRCPS